MIVRGVALGGFMGVGKTSVGRRLASVLGLPFVDLDEVLLNSLYFLESVLEKKKLEQIAILKKEIKSTLCF